MPKSSTSDFELPKWEFPNPFTDDYWHRELAFYGKPRASVIPHPSLQLDWPIIQGRCDDYLSVNWRIDDTPYPRLCAKNTLWMSLSPMEVQSAALAILLAKGRVVMGGLGLGYCALRMAAKKEVDEVRVYEMNPHIIEWFMAAFDDRPGFSKIGFVLGDMRQTCHDETADLAYVDIYDALLGDEVLTDSKLLRRKNQFTQYLYWGWERAWFDAMRHGVIKHAMFLPSYLLKYFRYWQATAKLRENHLLDKPFVKKAMNATSLLLA